MLGDWVRHGFGHEGKVTAIDSNVVTVYDKGFDDGDGHCEVTFAWNEIKPIPLTTEILEKNGFKRVPIDYDKEMRSECYACDGIDWVIYANQFMLCRKGDWVGLGIDITYVHELQHALRLTGIEKEIEL